MTTQRPPYDVKILIGILAEPRSRRVMFDGTVALFMDGAYWFVSEKLTEFVTPNIPTWFFDCYESTPLTAAGAEELGWFVNTLALSLADYPERWEAEIWGRVVVVEREPLRQQLELLGDIVRRARAEGRTVASLGD